VSGNRDSTSWAQNFGDAETLQLLSASKEVDGKESKVVGQGNYSEGHL